MKLKLLPHKIQKPAGIVFVVMLILLLTMTMLTLTLGNTTSAESSHSITFFNWLNSNELFLIRLLAIAFTLSLAALLFSEEKVEDEMISHLRLRAVAISVIIVIAFKLLEQVIWFLLPVDAIQSLREIRNDLRGGGVSVMIIIYLLVLKDLSTIILTKLMNNNLKVERAKHRMSQQELADKLHVSRQTINAIELGKFNPSTLLSLKMSRLLGVSVNELFYLEEGE